MDQFSNGPWTKNWKIGILDHDQDARHIWILLELYYIGNQLAAINFFLHVLYISEGDQCATTDLQIVCNIARVVTFEWSASSGQHRVISVARP